MTAATDQFIPTKSCHASVCTLPSPPLETIPTQYISDLQPAYTTTLVVECKRKQTDIRPNLTQKKNVLSGSHKRKGNELFVCNKHGLYGGHC